MWLETDKLIRKDVLLLKTCQVWQEVAPQLLNECIYSYVLKLTDFHNRIFKHKIIPYWSFWSTLMHKLTKKKAASQSFCVFIKNK